VGVATISKVVPEVCEAIWDLMKDTYIQFPNTPEQWGAVADNFELRWNFPNCIGAIDGKHIVITCPPNTGSLHYNYKGTFSMVLMAMADANYQFLYVDCSSYGCNSDAGIYAGSTLGQALFNGNEEPMNLPPDAPLRDAEEFGPLPFVAVGDEAFPLQKHLMRPYPARGADPQEEAYNYRHSRARRIVECTFGILATRWRVFHTKIAVLPKTVKLIVKAATVLHNMLQLTTTPAATTEMIADYRSDKTRDRIDGMADMRHYGTRGTNEASQIREKFRDYFVGYPLSWQERYLQAKSGNPDDQ